MWWQEKKAQPSHLCVHCSMRLRQLWVKASDLEEVRHVTAVGVNQQVTHDTKAMLPLGH